MRMEGNWTPVIMLTQVGSATERAMTLEEGADDYLNKPFDPFELVTRIKAVLRRVHPRAPPLTSARRLVSGPLTLDRPARRALLGGKEIPLTAIRAGLANAAESGGSGTSLETVQRQVDRLSRLVGQLQKLAELENRERLQMFPCIAFRLTLPVLLVAALWSGWQVPPSAGAWPDKSRTSLYMPEPQDRLALVPLNALTLADTPVYNSIIRIAPVSLARNTDHPYAGGGVVPSHGQWHDPGAIHQGHHRSHPRRTYRRAAGGVPSGCAALDFRHLGRWKTALRLARLLER